MAANDMNDADGLGAEPAGIKDPRHASYYLEGARRLEDKLATAQSVIAGMLADARALRAAIEEVVKRDG